MPPTRYTSRAVDPSPLGSPLTLPFSSVVLQNRFMKVAMTERLATWDPDDINASGIPTQQLIDLYGHWGDGGWGTIVTGNIIIDPTHLEAAGNMILASSPLSSLNTQTDPRFIAYQKLAAAGKRGGSVFLAQLNHPGRQTEFALQENPVSASDVQLTKGIGALYAFGKPHAASLDEISHIKAAFVHAAAYLEKAGFDGIQLHAAHGYLLAQFLSPTANLRTDSYGGSLTNRARLIAEIADGVRGATGPDFVLAIKINSVEFQDAGFSTEEAAQLVALLEEHRFDIVELSGGTYESPAWHHKRESTRRREAFFIEFAELVAPHVERARTFITGGIRTVGAMVDALESGLDGVGLGRPSATEPRLPIEILRNGQKGCIKPLVGDTNVLGGEDSWGVGASLAGAHMLQISLNQQPIDPSDQTSIDGFLKGFEKWVAAFPKRSKREVLDHVRIETVKPRPYGVVESSTA
ncbi:NADH oxidase [Annulohypoxylon maeteangense]|uniref:NADH oxidase n=1 Tax=Annulohypoxylon maeteangense TaxID=1927788 RepID=UPI002007D542|nr:NADH oxidase [Annulohypoxylon maeteangense]KAI0885430.1 NADH oxidase [Annulohypoxylon maeteangense]